MPVAAGQVVGQLGQLPQIVPRRLFLHVDVMHRFKRVLNSFMLLILCTGGLSYALFTSQFISKLERPVWVGVRGGGAGHSKLTEFTSSRWGGGGVGGGGGTK